MTTQKTLIIFKPDSVQRGVVGEILTRFERVGLKIKTVATVIMLTFIVASYIILII